MASLRPRSLSGLLSAALLLIVLPLTAAVVYGGVQLRQLSRTSDALVRDSIGLTQHTQVLFQNIAAMERSASLYAVLEDPRLATAFSTNERALEATLDRLEPLAPPIEIARVRAAARASSVLVHGARGAELSAGLVGRFDVLGAEANALADQTRRAIDTRLEAAAERADATRRWLLWAIMALVPAAIVLVAMFFFYVVRPLRAIDRAISDLGRGVFSQPIAIRGPADLAALGRQLEWLRTRLLEIAMERNRFLRHMSHELKTPLANIREGTDLLLDGAVGDLDDSQREVATILRDNAVRLQHLIENLLSYSAWQSSASTIELTQFRLESLVGAVVDSQRLALAAREVTLDLQVADLQLVADRPKLKLVLDNLLSNALKFTPRGGTIHLHAYQAGRSTIIDLADTGPGIPREERDKIFQAFYSGQTPQGGPIKGTGIGLSVVREFVQAHGGTIEIVDGQFSGAHLRIRLPIQQRKESSKEAAHAA
ncbi:MAG: HAMP domain-containing histidine kinase [Steroidobacteraceae bacterium]|nr:HAMP domain-containing histidine kinase [Steroidobacteraceae bacterium]